MNTDAASRRLSEDFIAFTPDQAARLAGITPWRLRRLEIAELVTPTVVRRLSERKTVRLYGFDDLQALLVWAELRDQVSDQQLRLVLGRLGMKYKRPLNELRWGTHAGEVIFQHPDGSWEGGLRADQIIFINVIQLEPVRARIREAVGRRQADDIGRTHQVRRVMAHKPVFAGTRIPVASVEEYVREGFDDTAILDAFPRLTRDDIALVRSHIAS